MYEVELIGLSKSYGDQIVLADVSIGFRKEKITAIIGRSGSGKSTLLKSINGLIKPTTGKVLVSGQPLDYDNINNQRHRIGYVIQGSGLFPHLTVEDNILLPSKFTGQAGKSITTLLSLAELPLSYLKKYPWQLSGGEQQRVALCRALLLNPPLLLMDEPFGSLDTETRHGLQRKILELRDQFKITMIVVTHDIPEANTLGDDVITIDKGKIVR